MGEFQRRGHVGQVAGFDVHLNIVFQRIAAGEVSVVCLKFQPVKVQAGDPAAKAKRGGPGPAAKVQHGLAKGRGAGGCKQHGVSGGAIPFQWLPQVQPPTEEGVVRQIIL